MYTVQILVEAVHDEMRDMLAVLLSTNLITIKRCLVMVIDKWTRLGPESSLVMLSCISAFLFPCADDTVYISWSANWRYLNNWKFATTKEFCESLFSFSLSSKTLLIVQPGLRALKEHEVTVWLYSLLYLYHIRVLLSFVGTTMSWFLI